MYLLGKVWFEFVSDLESLLKNRIEYNIFVHITNIIKNTKHLHTRINVQKVAFKITNLKIPYFYAT